MRHWCDKDRFPGGWARAIGSLEHPAALAAIALLTVNAAVLQPFYPSWFSGKLGDAAGLVFIPFVVALPLALVIQRVEWVGALAIAITGGGFAAVKLIEPVNAFVAANLPVKATFDATDLLALPALAAAWMIWQHPFEWRGQPNMFLKTAPLALALVALLADSPAPTPAPPTLTRIAEQAPTRTAEAATRIFLAPTKAAQTQEARVAALPTSGIVCLRIEDNALIAGTYAFDFRSTDGGMTWQQMNTERRLDFDCERRYFQEPKQLIYQDPLTWGVEYWVYPDTIKRRASNSSGLQGEVKIDPSAVIYDVEFDPNTRHVVAAVGKDGVFVRAPNGKWQFVGVGEFKR